MQRPEAEVCLMCWRRDGGNSVAGAERVRKGVKGEEFEEALNYTCLFVDFKRSRKLPTNLLTVVTLRNKERSFFLRQYSVLILDTNVLFECEYRWIWFLTF